VPCLVHDPHAAATDLGQDVEVSDLPGDGENARLGFRAFPSRGSRGLLVVAQSADRRAALGRGDQAFFLVGSSLLESQQQRVGSGRPIEAAATGWTIVEVGQDAGQLGLGELPQRQPVQFFVRRVVQWSLAHGKPARVRWSAHRWGAFPLQ
jgi:hypothetical protein